jgi:hypothetical protein
MESIDLLQLRRTTGRRQRIHRAGISILEAVSCLFALVGGAYLGALYLGVDVRHVAYTALKDSQLLDRVPEKWRPASPDAKPGAEPLTPEQLAQHVEHELVALRQEVSGLRTSRENAPSSSGTGESATTTSDSRPTVKDASVAYWKRLNDIVRDQSALQRDSESAATEGNASQVAALKSRVCRFASSAIQAIPTDGVDPTATEFGKQLASWYDHGGELYDSAVRIWESPARSQNGSPISENWDQTKEHHHNEGRLLSERSAVVRDSLVRRFGNEFAALAKL